MSQKLTPDNTQKGFAVGRGLLAAAETLNFSMSESRPDPYGSSSQQHGGLMGLGGVESQDSQLGTRRVGNHLGNTMKLFASLGLSPNDLDALAQVPEENISVETLPHLIMQLKNRKAESSRHLGGDLLSQSLSPDPSYRGGRDKWDMQGGRLDRSTASTSQSRTSQSDFGYSSTQDLSSRSYDMLDYGGSGSSRDRQYSELSTDRYRGLGTTSSSASDDLFMQRRMGYPSQGKIQDFLGVMPHMFPHVCSLCDFDVHSSMVSSSEQFLSHINFFPIPEHISHLVENTCVQNRFAHQWNLGVRPVCLDCGPHLASAVVHVHSKIFAAVIKVNVNIILKKKKIALGSVIHCHFNVNQLSCLGD